MQSRFHRGVLGSSAVAAFALTLTGIFLSSAPQAQADERRFAYSYETTTAPAGSFELENTMTWKNGDGFNKFQFQHEFEFGITDRFQLGFYVFNWALNHENHATDSAWEGSGFEAIYQLTDPNKSFLGSALYFESVVSDEAFSMEAKLLLQKNLGPVVLVYNAVVESEWEEDYKERVGVLEQTFGVSYQINPSFMVGMEAVHEVEFADWSDAGEHVLSVGPNFSYRKGRFFVTMAGLFQATAVAGEPDFQLRSIVGFDF